MKGKGFIKSALGKLHLWLGMATGLVVLIVSLTGCLFVFEQELQRLIYHDQLTVQAQKGQLLAPGTIADRVSATFRKTAIQRIYRRLASPDPALTDTYQVILKDKRLVSIDPYQGQVLGVRNLKTDFFAVVREIHTTLMLGKTGSHIIGWSVIVYLFLLISGLVLWWPRYKAAMSKAALKQKFTIRWSARWRRVNYDWHSVGGFYALWILVVIACTGLIWSFEWWENGLYKLTGSPPRDRTKAVSTLPAARQTQTTGRSTQIDAMVARTNALETGATELYVIFPADSVGAYRVQFRYDEGSFYRKYTIQYYDQYSGQLVTGKRYSDFSAGDKARGAAYDLHTGGWLGLPGKILAFLASLFSASLPVSGFLVWWGRRRKACQVVDAPVKPASVRRKRQAEPVANV
ncbi:PepSY-associated TM helix domain-containing protein [Rudanella lutea]|uniref:PepSY-associated TM helix domain-containing protein n=1 Tax=Rudanella lutea TaxID=451374 RepID=UPI00039C048E|nr:PepSY-associated TM helix domain-containing protein [Rudanella lutea]